MSSFYCFVVNLDTVHADACLSRDLDELFIIYVMMRYGKSWTCRYTHASSSNKQTKTITINKQRIQKTNKLKISTHAKYVNKPF